LSYAPADEQPSIFLLAENARQAVLTVFNWTESSRTRAINLTQLGLQDPDHHKLIDVLGDEGCCDVSSGTLHLVQKPHSVRMIKLVDNTVPAMAPSINLRAPVRGTAGEALTFQADAASREAPLLTCHWDFGDGTSLEGTRVQHAYTRPGDYQVAISVTGLDSVTNHKTVTVSIAGAIATRFDPTQIRRAE